MPNAREVSGSTKSAIAALTAAIGDDLFDEVRLADRHLLYKRRRNGFVGLIDEAFESEGDYVAFIRSLVEGSTSRCSWADIVQMRSGTLGLPGGLMLSVFLRMDGTDLPVALIRKPQLRSAASCGS